MADINVENFYRHIAKILHILYTHFPTRAALYVDEVAGIDEPDEYGLHSPTYTAGFFAMLWLADEGFIKYADTIRQDGIDQAFLTHRAFLILTQPTDKMINDFSQATGSDAKDSDPKNSDPKNSDPKNSDTSKSGNVVNLQPVEEISPSLQEEKRLVISQLRAALRSGSSIAINKVVDYILRA